MKCWKCKQEMPDGVKYCGNCGVHLNRGAHYLQMLFTPVPMRSMVYSMDCNSAIPEDCLWQRIA